MGVDPVDEVGETEDVGVADAGAAREERLPELLHAGRVQTGGAEKPHGRS